MIVQFFKTRFTEADFASKDETSVEAFQDEINGYIHDLKEEGCEDIDITFKFFDDGRAIATIVTQDWS